MGISIISNFLSPSVGNEVSKLEDSKRSRVENIFFNQKYNPSTCFWLAVFGFHYVYLKKWGLFAAYALTGGGLSVWWLADLFRAGKLARSKNDELVYNLMSSL